jgi:hypothetical protein
MTTSGDFHMALDTRSLRPRPISASRWRRFAAGHRRGVARVTVAACHTRVVPPVHVMSEH